MPSIELLSPAKNLECGLAAINHGADAVYIGAPEFSARVNAGNSIEDIEKLVKHAHQYRCKVLVALNTVLTDEQLPRAEKIINQIYEVGADALIVQDMGVLKLNLPPIALHASTQTDNRTIEKVQFLEKAGFSRIVLARELSLHEISHIASKTNVKLEAFIHGALCVSYSGQCYISQAICKRSANRGECAQFCRLPYDLVDADENLLVKNKHLLSLKDLNLSEHLEQLMDAGVSSFKIEGRLKEADYVKNITVFYRKKLDEILERKAGYKKSSIGKTMFFFEPAPDKSFNRGFTNYFLVERQPSIIQADTPKSLGEKIGKVEFLGRNYIQLSSEKKMNNGDGLCFINTKDGILEGFRVNKADGVLVYPAEMPVISSGTVLYRNFDAEFDRTMRGKTSERKIAVDVLLVEIEAGFSVKMTDEEGIATEQLFSYEKQLAKKPEGIVENIKIQFSKLGNTVYEIRSIDVLFERNYFLPNSVLTEWRRKTVDELDKAREKLYQRPEQKKDLLPTYTLKSLSHLENITNSLAEAFYREHGVEEIANGFEINQLANTVLMRCKHCIKYSLGYCPKQGSNVLPKEPLSLKNKNQLFKLVFNCAKCEMEVYQHTEQAIRS